MLAKIHFGKTYFRGERPDTSSLNSINTLLTNAAVREILGKFGSSCYCCSSKVNSCCNSSLTFNIGVMKQCFRSTDSLVQFRKKLYSSRAPI